MQKNNEEESLQNLEENVLKTICTFESRCLALYADKNHFILFYKTWKINIVQHLEFFFRIFIYEHLKLFQSVPGTKPDLSS